MNEEIEKLKEEYCIANGWEKVKGYRINTEDIGSDYDTFYVDYENAEDYIEKDVVFWRAKEDSDEPCGYEDIDEVIEIIEDYEGVDSFEDWKKKQEAQNG